MDNYFRIYFQKDEDGAVVVDTINDYGMYCMENPFKPFGSIKEPSKRTWHDEDGDDEYIGERLFMEAYETKVKFGFKGNAYGANDAVRDFISYLVLAGKMRMYCEFNDVGRRDVRLKEIDPILYRDPRQGDLLILTITLKINNPTTEVYPVKKDGKITALNY